MLDVDETGGYVDADLLYAFVVVRGVGAGGVVVGGGGCFAYYLGDDWYFGGTAYSFYVERGSTIFAIIIIVIDIVDVVIVN